MASCLRCAKDLEKDKTGAILSGTIEVKVRRVDMIMVDTIIGAYNRVCESCRKEAEEALWMWWTRGEGGIRE